MIPRRLSREILLTVEPVCEGHVIKVRYNMYVITIYLFRSFGYRNLFLLIFSIFFASELIDCLCLCVCVLFERTDIVSVQLFSHLQTDLYVNTVAPTNQSSW